MPGCDFVSSFHCRDKITDKPMKEKKALFWFSLRKPSVMVGLAWLQESSEKASEQQRSLGESLLGQSSDGLSTQSQKGSTEARGARVLSLTWASQCSSTEHPLQPELGLFWNPARMEGRRDLWSSGKNGPGCFGAKDKGARPCPLEQFRAGAVQRTHSHSYKG